MPPPSKRLVAFKNSSQEPEPREAAPTSQGFGLPFVARDEGWLPAEQGPSRLAGITRLGEGPWTQPPGMMNGAGNCPADIRPSEGRRRQAEACQSGGKQARLGQAPRRSLRETAWGCPGGTQRHTRQGGGVGEAGGGPSLQKQLKSESVLPAMQDGVQSYQKGKPRDGPPIPPSPCKALVSGLRI